MQLTFTGHRPQKLGGFNATPFHNEIKRHMEAKLKSYQPEIVYVGMALGVDQWAAELCLKLRIPYIACIPFANQDIKWAPKSRQHYSYLLRKAARVVEVDRQPGYIERRPPPGVYSARKMFNRNMYMIDQLKGSDKLIAVVQRYYHGSGSSHAIEQMINRMGGESVDFVYVDQLPNAGKYIEIDDVPF